MARVDYPGVVGELIGELKRLPGVGPRSAERIAIWLLQNERANPLELAAALHTATTEVRSCPLCGFFATSTGCSVCDDTRRDDARLCVVEQPAEVLPIERSGAFNGRYHCLGGKLSPLDNVTPEDLRIGELVRRVSASAESVEVVLAVGADVEGEATASYLADVLRGKNCQVTRLAQGLPAGGGLEFADDLTLTRAFEGRKNF
ncbi:recombination mediator RecR [Roseibacillus persicicus]|uniref:recombination mediator RecR n=1 Tax=Roseibacillus persicicus TaxID=454148 RepID=UPI00280DE216|nr:recombination mediator RecR [Roseibacillus persicicus]MDQ8189612.1 recombination mediator RecR [Roseibacillus persicicus]